MFKVLRVLVPSWEVFLAFMWTVITTCWFKTRLYR
jgi:hypothetical protein